MNVRSFIATSIVAVLGVTVPSGPAAAEPHVLTWTDGSEITTLNPFIPGAAPNNDLNTLTMAYLIRYGTTHPTAELASAVPTQANGGISHDGRTITYHLRRDAKWSDGKPLTSADVAFTYKLIMDPKTNILDRFGFTFVQSVSTPDASTAVFRLTRPYAPMVSILFSTISYPIIPQHLLAGTDFNTAAWQQLPVGAGPFRFTKWLRGDRVELEANPYYPLPHPKLTRMIYRMIPNTASALNSLRTGAVDMVTRVTYTDYEPLSHLPDIHSFLVAGIRPSSLVLNAQSPLLSDPNVRRALRAGLNRRGILLNSYHGAGVLGETLLIPTDPAAAKIRFVAYDPKRAEAMLDAAGWRRAADGVRAKDGRRLVLQVVAGAGSAFVDQVLELVRADWSRIGVGVETKRYPLSLLFAPASNGGITYGGKFDAAFYSTRSLLAEDLSTGVTCAEVAPKGTNVARLCDPALDALLDRADSTYDERAANALYAQAQQRLFDDVDRIIVARRNEYYLYRDGVTGIEILPFGVFSKVTQFDMTR